MSYISQEETANHLSPRRRLKVIVSIVLLILICLACSSLWLAPEYISAQPQNAAAAFEPHQQVGHDHTASGHHDEGVTLGKVLFYTVRALYYFALMLTAGAMLWSIALPAGMNEGQRRMMDKWSLPVIRGLLLTVLVFVFVHMISLLKGYDGGSANEWLRILTETAIGRSWLGLIAVSLLGFVVLRLQDSFKMVWALLLLASESFNGHVNALPSNTMAIVFDFIHLAASALWAGGLMLLLFFWYADRREAGWFAERFTKAAWLSIVALTASGIGMTALLLPSWRYLLYTTWGLMLVAKAVLVVLVAVTGFFLRRRAKRQELPNGKLLKLDFLLMSVILIIAAIFTYISPVPEGNPLSHHQMGDRLHYTLAITPNAPGPNQVKLKVWLPEQLGAPASIQLRLRSDDYPQKKAVEVPLVSDYTDEDFTFPGFKETDYFADEVELPYRGAWTAELVIVDQAGEETVKKITFRND
ncbi:copper resistance D family protein [Paenibacillus sp. sgz302251]|uniref:copper resistance D family protein n=1 Tax=Paenibacillus sp. sgz302251 TaxID=3414493 RepID=UPI003C7DED00